MAREHDGAHIEREHEECGAACPARGKPHPETRAPEHEPRERRNHEHSRHHRSVAAEAEHGKREAYRQARAHRGQQRVRELVARQSLGEQT